MSAAEGVHELFLNYACNAKCVFCYNPPITPELLRRELSFEQAAQSLYRGARSGLRRLNLHGGEVTLRDDLEKIMGLARKLGFSRITLVTNGLRLSQPDYARALVNSGATHFRLSVHGPDAAAHDAILEVPGAFEKVLRAVENLRALAVPFGMNFVIHEANYLKLPAFLERFCLREGVPEVIVYFPHLRGMMEINAARSGVTYEQVLPAVREGASLLRKAKRLRALALANFTPCLAPELADLMLDWSRGAESSPMTNPEGFTQDLGQMKDAQRVRVSACGRCALGSSCLGVEREYRRRYGEGAFAPLEAEPMALPA